MKYKIQHSQHFGQLCTAFAPTVCNSAGARQRTQKLLMRVHPFCCCNTEFTRY